MRVPTVVAVVLLSGLACLGVPSAGAADELPPTPTETSAVTAPAEEPVAEPTDVPTSEVTAPEPEESAAPTEGPVEPSGEEVVAAEGAASGTTEAVDPTPPDEEPDDSRTEAEGDAAEVERATAVAEETLVAAAEVVRDPRASIDEVSCTNLTLEVVLDNSQSTVPVGFEVVVSIDDEEESTFEETMPAGGGRIVYLPVTEDTEITVSVLEQS